MLALGRDLMLGHDRLARKPHPMPHDRRLLSALFAAASLMLVACTAGSGEGGSTAGYPTLLPIDQVLAGVEDGTDGTHSAGNLAARAARLKARARALGGPVLDAAARARLTAAVTRHNG